MYIIFVSLLYRKYLIIFKRSLVESLVDFKYIHAICKYGYLEFSLLICIHFISFLYFFDLAKTLSSILNNNGDSGALVLFHILEEMLSVFPHLVKHCL